MKFRSEEAERDYIIAELENLKFSDEDISDIIEDGYYFYGAEDLEELGVSVWENDIMELANRDISQQLEFVQSCIDYADLGRKYLNLRDLIEFDNGGFLETY